MSYDFIKHSLAKVMYDPSDYDIVKKFLNLWINPKSKVAILLDMEECEPIYFQEEVHNVIMELERVGFTESVKRIFQGDHFYRSDTGKCPRCYRYRPEIHWNNENIPDIKGAELCDRCYNVLNS